MQQINHKDRRHIVRLKEKKIFDSENSTAKLRTK